MAQAIGNFSIDQFKSNLDKYGIARPYLFNIIPNIPEADSEMATYLVRSTQMPGKMIEPKELPWQGMIYKYGGNTTFENWTVTFTVDGKAELYKKFTSWSDMIHNPETNEHGDPGVYMQDQHVDLLGNDGTSSILRIKLFSAWPTNVGPIELAYDNTDIATFDVEFVYLRHMIEK